MVYNRDIVADTVSYELQLTFRSYETWLFHIPHAPLRTIVQMTPLDMSIIIVQVLDIVTFVSPLI